MEVTLVKVSAKFVLLSIGSIKIHEKGHSDFQQGNHINFKGEKSWNSR
jgi:hypothetical protein